MADVLDQLSTVIGRPVKPLERVQKPAARNPYMAADNPKGLAKPGNLSIWDRPSVQNADGSHSSELSFSREDDGKEVLVPSIVDGKFLTPDGKMPPLGHRDKSGKYIPTPQEKAMQDKAWDHYKKTGQHLGMFDNPDDADAYANILHNRGEKGSGSRDEAAGSFKGTPSLESVIGRKLKPELPPLATARFKMYGQAVKNGFTPDIAAKTAMAEASVMNADPSTWRKVKSAIRDTPTGTGHTFGQVGEALGDVLHRGFDNPMGISDERWQQAQKEFNDYIDKKQKEFGPGPASEFTAGVYKGLYQFAGESASPGQLALLVGTFGESALVRAAAKLGIEGAPAVARTLSKLMQVQFGAQMVEGTATGIEDTVKAASRGDWQSAGESAVEGLVSGVMARGLVTHEVAQEKVRGDHREDG